MIMSNFKCNVYNFKCHVDKLVTHALGNTAKY